MVNALERLTEEVKCVRVQGKGKIYIQQKGLNLILGIPGPDNSVWSGGLFSIIIRCSESKSFYNYVRGDSMIFWISWAADPCLSGTKWFR